MVVDSWVQPCKRPHSLLPYRSPSVTVSHATSVVAMSDADSMAACGNPFIREEAQRSRFDRIAETRTMHSSAEKKAMPIRKGFLIGFLYIKNNGGHVLKDVPITSYVAQALLLSPQFRR
jgi:hypothetical protein